MKFAHARSRLPRPKLRTLMIAVAATAIPMALWAEIEARSQRFRRLATYHRSLMVSAVRVGLSPGHLGVVGITPGGEAVTQEQIDLDLWHLGLYEKYINASLRPWLAVPPDPERPGEGGKERRYGGR